ncbi:tetratricopeptide repeat protein [Bacteroidales bacterium OttesenSCG-928-C19]|nr:tetratricopeptide repeat protein [Bacteroidales bacterium OttesenSCG-928-C19]
MKEKREENNLEINEVVDRTEDFIAKNQRIIIVVVAAILVVVLGYFGVKKLYLEPREGRASEALFGAENYFAQGNYELALKGDGTFLGLIDVIDDYSSTKSGNLAKYYAGISSLKLGQFEEAASYLSSYKGNDTFTKVLAIIGAGDAYMELGNTSKAISFYKKASELKSNEVTAPYALFKLGLAYYMNQEPQKALEAFNSIKTNYPQSSEVRELDKYIALVE